MPKNADSLNRSLFELLQSKGYDPTMLNTSGKEIPTPEEAEVFQFNFIKDGEDYGKVTMSIDGLHKLIIYYDDDIANSEKESSESGDLSWYQLLNQLKKFSQKYQLSFELRNVSNLKHDMAKREYMKKKESIAEGYYPMGKKASYSDAVPSVKIVLQHTRQIEEGEQRYRNIAKIFLENENGERFLAPTIKPGIARVYARHLAEGGLANDDRWNHIKSLCEEYQKMAGFVRATRNGQFNESTQKLIAEGINHYQSLRESLGKLAGHRGYNMYFESWTPTLMEDDSDTSTLNELFVQETVDPRIESVMPILARLSKNINEMNEVNELAEWADKLVEGDEDIEDNEADDAVDNAEQDLTEAPGAETLAHNQNTEAGNLKKLGLAEKEVEEGVVDTLKKAGKKVVDFVAPDDEELLRDLQKKAGIPSHAQHAKPRMAVPRDEVNEEEVEESGLQAYLGNKKYGKEGMDALRQAGREGASKEKMAQIRAKYDKLDEEGVAEGSMKDLHIDLQDQQWDAIVGYVITGLKKNMDIGRMELNLYKYAGQEMFDVDQELQDRGFKDIADLANHIKQYNGKYVPPTDFDLGKGVAEGSEDYQEIFQMNTKQGKVGAVVQYKDKSFGFIYGTQLDPRKFDRAREAQQALNAHHNKQGVAEGYEGDDRGDYHKTAKAANQASRTAKTKEDHRKAADLHNKAATYGLSAGQDQSVIRDHQMAAAGHHRAIKGVKEGVAEAATPASVSTVLRLIQRHHSDWFDTYGIGEVEDAVVDMAEMGQFRGTSAAVALKLVGDELESMYGAQGMAEAKTQKKEVVGFTSSDKFKTWKQYAQKEGYEIREAGTLPGSYAAFDDNGERVGYFYNEFDLPNGYYYVGEIIITSEKQGVAEADELRARGGLAAVNKKPRIGQTDMRNIPVGNHPDARINKFTDKDRAEHPSRLKAKIKSTLGKHTRPNLPEQGVAEDLDSNQKRVGQLGPTEKVKNNNIGKLVGASESIEAKLKAITEMDKSQPSSDRGGESSGNPYAKGSKATPISAKKAKKDFLGVLQKSVDKHNKAKQDTDKKVAQHQVKEGQEDLDAILRIIRK